MKRKADQISEVELSTEPCPVSGASSQMAVAVTAVATAEVGSFIIYESADPGSL